MAKILPGDAAPLEDHLVLGEGAGLVAEHVLHLAKLLGDVERPALHPLLVYLPHISGSLWISQTCEILVSSMVT